ncbi:MAG TPA: hypothetical protein VEG64_13115 [Candidatus Sulfotelmatobacter sp.]|nr:hypothetical protein [Candidatus Sulfotelmatobacter sp.]
MAVCSGGVSLTPELRVELLAILSTDEQRSISDRAKSTLMNLPLESYMKALAVPDADERLFKYCAANNAEKPGLADLMAKNPACPTAVLAQVARHFTSAGIQALLDDMERLISDGNLVAALSQSQAASREQQDLLGEVHKDEALPLAEMEEAAKEIEPDPVKRETLTKRVMHMNVVQRLTLALKGGREERMLLIRDPNKLVQRCVLQSPRLTDTEVEGFSKMTNVSEEVLRTISLTRKFMKSYVVAKGLVNNAKTPLDVSLHLLPRLNATDLKMLTNNKNVPETLRSTAIKLQRQRSKPGD